jgi:hypothetical protein
MSAGLGPRYLLFPQGWAVRPLERRVQIDLYSLINQITAHLPKKGLLEAATPPLKRVFEVSDF